MKCQVLFSRKNKKNFSMSSAEILPRVLSVNSHCSFSTDHSKSVLLLQFFVCVSLISYVAFCHYLFLIFPSFGILGRLCIMIVAVPGYLHLFHLKGKVR